LPESDSRIHLSDSRLARLVSSTPAALADKMRETGHLAGERRIVTALFADVVGSTALAEQLDPEVWTVIMNRAFELLVPVIFRYEGTIARLMGDALLAFFGAPVAHEDDPIRAVYAGLDLIGVARDYSEELRNRFRDRFMIRVGLNTGEVVTGEVGSNLVYEYTAMGDAINLAARMQSIADPMTIRITENTYRVVAPAFECIDRGEIPIKGRSEPVRTYEVVQLKSKPESFRGLAGLESPLVGRDVELLTLMKMSVAVQGGFGRAALVLGEAGLGKSRLIAEWKRNAVSNPASFSGNGKPIKWAEGRCLSYGQGLAYHLIINLLESLFEAIGDTGETNTALQLKRVTEDLFGEKKEEFYPYLGHLLSIPLEDEHSEKVGFLDPQALQMQYLRVLSQLFREIAGHDPLVLILEDVHWADPSSVELVAKLIPLVFETPILFCCLSRPDREAPGWRLVNSLREILGNGLTEISLESLSMRDSDQLITNLLRINSFPAIARERILAKAEGNPLFVEEVIRMLIERGVIQQSDQGWVLVKEIEAIEIPDNIHSLLLARLDRLPDEAKQTLKIASVIGRDFSLTMLEQILQEYEN
jgi:class 3 adenylate cyclase